MSSESNFHGNKTKISKTLMIRTSFSPDEHALILKKVLIHSTVKMIIIYFSGYLLTITITIS